MGSFPDRTLWPAVAHVRSNSTGTVVAGRDCVPRGNEAVATVQPGPAGRASLLND